MDDVRQISPKRLDPMKLLYNIFKLKVVDNFWIAIQKSFKQCEVGWKIRPTRCEDDRSKEVHNGRSDITSAGNEGVYIGMTRKEEEEGKQEKRKQNQEHDIGQDKTLFWEMLVVWREVRERRKNKQGSILVH